MDFRKDNIPSDSSRYIKRFISIKTAIIFLFLVVVIVAYLLAFSSPVGFPENSIFTVKKGETLSSVAVHLKDEGYIRSEFVFKVLVYCLDGKAHVNAGNYRFVSRSNLFTLAYRINRGRFDNLPIKIIIPEGLNTKEIAEILSSGMPNFNKADFILKAKKLEGYLFPDTYVFSDEMKTEDIIFVMNENFKEKISEDGIDQQIKSFNKPLSDIIKMASILEGEARQLETRRIVAGILWKRISLKMPLQVDTVFKYELGKTTFTLTTDDLRTDSPYNTYTRLGLPPTPVSNPGLESIIASVTPINTNYLYFLTDDNGVMHYAVTHDEHVLNKNKYLSN